MRVAIIGGGVAGLVAAFTLQKHRRDCHVDLFESSSRLGGAIRTETIGEFLVEHGADMFATEPPAVMELCKELGIEHELQCPLPTVRGAAIVQNRKLIRIPDGFVLMRPTRLMPMVTTPLLSIAGKLRLLAEPLIPRRVESVADESIESFVQRRLGRETLDRIVQPLVGGIYTGDVAQLSMAATMQQFWEMERRDGSLFRATLRRNREGTDSAEQNSAGARYEKFRSFPTGMERLVQSLVAQTTTPCFHCSTPIHRMEHVGDRWRLEFEKPANEQLYDHVIMATPATASAKLLKDACPVASNLLGGIEFASSAVVVLGIRDTDYTVKLPIAGFVVPHREGREILAASFTSDKFPGRAPHGFRMLRVFIGGMLQRELLEKSDEELIDLARHELRDLIGLSGTPSLVKVIRWNHAMPQYYVGHLARISAIESAIAREGGLSMIGNSLYGVGIAPTVATARKVALSLTAPSGPV